MYPPEIDKILDRVFDEFGLIICGWSARWDDALRSAIARCPSRRFTTYWASPSELDGPAKAILDSRRGISISIKNADDFFTQLEEKVSTLDGLGGLHPLSVASAEATAKRLLSEDRHYIRLSDLVNDETEQACDAIESLLRELLRSTGDNAAKFSDTIEQSWAQTEILRTILINVAFWGAARHTEVVVAALQRLALDELEENGSGTMEPQFRMIPCITVLYGCGVAAICRRNYTMLLAALTKPLAMVGAVRNRLLLQARWNTMQQAFALLPDRKRQPLAASNWLFERWRLPLRRFMPSKFDYEQAFDAFEVTKALVVLLLRTNGKPLTGSVAQFPQGRFVWKAARQHADDRDIFENLAGDRQLLAALQEFEIFKGNEKQFTSTLTHFEKSAKELGIPLF